MTLGMRPIRERRSANVEPDTEAYICSYECTYCSNCAQVLNRRCPNCTGELARRPRRENRS